MHGRKKTGNSSLTWPMLFEALTIGAMNNLKMSITILGLLLYGDYQARAQNSSNDRNFFFNSAGFAIESYGNNASSRWLRNNGVPTPARLYGASGELMTGRRKIAYGIEVAIMGANYPSAAFLSTAMGFTFGYQLKGRRFAIIPQLSTGWYLSSVGFGSHVPSLIALEYPSAKYPVMHSFSWYLNPHIDLIKPFGDVTFAPGLGFTLGYHLALVSSRWDYGQSGGGKVDSIPRPVIGYPYIAVNLTITGW